MAQGLLARLPESLDELLAGVGQDLAQAVVGLDVAELLVGGTLRLGRGGSRPPGGALGLFASDAGLLEELAFDRGQALLDVGAGRRRGRGLARGRSPAAQVLDLRVSVLDLFEPARRLGGAVVVVGVVQLNQPPIGGAELRVRDPGLDAEDRVRVGGQELHPGTRPRGAAGLPLGGGAQRPAVGAAVVSAGVAEGEPADDQQQAPGREHGGHDHRRREQ